MTERTRGLVSDELIRSVQPKPGPRQPLPLLATLCCSSPATAAPHVPRLILCPSRAAALATILVVAGFVRVVAFDASIADAAAISASLFIIVSTSVVLGTGETLRRHAEPGTFRCGSAAAAAGVCSAALRAPFLTLLLPASAPLRSASDAPLSPSLSAPSASPAAAAAEHQGRCRARQHHHPGIRTQGLQPAE